MLELNNCKIGYGSKIILDNINLKIEDNEIVGIMGGNGSGKTTLLKTITSIIPLIDGKYYIDSKSFKEYSIKERAKKISYLPQKSGIVYSINTVDVILMGVTPYLSIFGSPSAEHKKQAIELMRRSGIERLIDRNFLELSEGEKQLVLIAKNLMQGSQLMIFDEPSSSLDFNNTYMFMDNVSLAIREHGKSAIITIHDPNLALMYCDKIIALKDGKIISTIIMKNTSLEELQNTFDTLYSGVKVFEENSRYYVLKERENG